jgi:hypothetical protein
VRGPPGSVRFLGDVVLAHRPDYFFTVGPLVSGFHEVVVRFGGDRFPFSKPDFDRSDAVVVGALAQEWHRLRLRHLLFDGVV